MNRALLLSLLICSAALGQKIQDQPDLPATSVSRPELVRLPVADMQAGGFGTGRDIGIDVLSDLARSKMLVYEHGMTDSEIGWPLVGESLYDDTVASVPTAVIVDTYGTDRIRVAPIGAFLSLPVTLIDTGAAYDPDVSGYHLYWDRSAQRYKGTKPADSAPSNGHILTIIYMGDTEFVSVVSPKQESVYGTVIVEHADGTTETFSPTAISEDARGDALEAALNAMVKSPTAERRGSTCILQTGVTYALDDLTINDKDGCTVIGNGATIVDPDGDYDYILWFKNSDDLIVRDLTVQGSTTDQDSPTNDEVGAGIRFQLCDRLKIQHVTSTWHCGTEGGDVEFPINEGASGFVIEDSDDIQVVDCESSRNGRYGFEIRECPRARLNVIRAINNGRVAINIVNDDVSPGTTTISNFDGYSDVSFTDLLMAGSPGISIGSGEFWEDAVVNIVDATIEWSAPGIDSSSQGGVFGCLKVTDAGRANITNASIRHGDNSGNADIISASFHNVDNVNLINVNTDSDVRNLAGRVELLTLTNCQINTRIEAAFCLPGFEADRAIIRGSEFWFTDYAFALETQAGNSREVTGCVFNGAALSDYVFRASDDITLAAGKLKVHDNQLNNCSYTNTAEKLAQIATGGRVTLPVNEESPELTAGVTQYVTANTSTTDYLDFGVSAFDVAEGLEITIEVNDGNTSVTHSGDVKLDGAVDFDPGSGGGVITLRHRGGVWRQVGAASSF